MRKILSDAKFRRRVLFIVAHLAVCAMIAGVLVTPTYTFFADRDNRIGEQKNVLARLSAIAGQAANIQSIVSDTKAQMQGGEFLVGPNENVISADLQTKLKAITESTGARARAIQSLPIKTTDQIRYSGSRIEIFGSLQSILRAVHAIEGSKPYLFITGAALKILPAAGQEASQDPVIQAQLDVFGAMQVGAQP